VRPIKDRIKTLRKALGLTQQEFADKIGIKRGAVANYELGRNEPIDAVLSLICREFHVDEHWLRTGEGEMFVRLSLEEELAQYAAQVLTDPAQELQRELLRIMARLDPQDWSALERIAKKIRQEP
jgi:transcriptional regulator with XRE-family HTH domain